MYIGTVDALEVWQIVVIAGHQRGQRLQVVAQHLGGDILHDSQLKQTRDVFQAKAMLEPLEHLLDASALVVELANSTGGKACRVEQVGQC